MCKCVKNIYSLLMKNELKIGHNIHISRVPCFLVGSNNYTFFLIELALQQVKSETLIEPLLYNPIQAIEYHYNVNIM